MTVGVFLDGAGALGDIVNAVGDDVWCDDSAMLACRM